VKEEISLEERKLKKAANVSAESSRKWPRKRNSWLSGERNIS
jgi:hypothetical protein